MRRVIAALGAALLVALGALAIIEPTTSHVAGAVPLTPGIAPDAVLSPGQEFKITSTDVHVADPAFFHQPSECRDVPYSETCTAYRIQLKRDPSPDAFNFVSFTVDYTPLLIIPPLPAVALALTPSPIGNLDVHVWDQDDHYLGQNYPTGSDIKLVLGLVEQVPEAGPVVAPELSALLLGDDAGDPNDLPPGGDGFDEPKHGGFTVKQDSYDIVIGTTSGANLGYTLTVRFSNEKFSRPDEILGAPTGPISPPPDGTVYTPPFEADSGSVVTPLPDASVLPDSDIAGIGSGINEQFNSPLLTAIGRARPINANAKPPSDIALIAGMIAFPALALGGGVWTLRRRRRALLA